MGASVTAAAAPGTACDRPGQAFHVLDQPTWGFGDQAIMTYGPEEGYWSTEPLFQAVWQQVPYVAFAARKWQNFKGLATVVTG